MKAVCVVRHPSGAVEEIPITATPAEIDQFVEQGVEVWIRWSLLDLVVLAVWCLIGLAVGVAALAWTLPVS